jgi:hypothetical protein
MSDQPERRPEPYATLLELVAEHGAVEVVRDLSLLLEHESEEPENFTRTERKWAAGLSLELEVLADRYEALEDVNVYVRGRKIEG